MGSNWKDLKRMRTFGKELCFMRVKMAFDRDAVAIGGS